MGKRNHMGMVAILDALGAATYSEREVRRFLQSRDLVINKLQSSPGSKIDPARLKVFTFNDTVVIVCLARPEAPIDMGDLNAFLFRLRAFIYRSFENGILFRGALSAGRFYRVEDDTNTVMGPAVSDAAAWYDKTEWIGISATPYASIYFSSLDGAREPRASVEYDVPVRGAPPVRVWAVNWPSLFCEFRGSRPPGRNPRGKLLHYLAEHQVPRGTESKYTNTLAFFDHVVQHQDLDSPTTTEAPRVRTRQAGRPGSR